MRLSIIKIVFLKELREMLRDRRSLLVMFGFPLVLYPLLTIAIANIGATRKRQLDEELVKVVVVDALRAPHLVDQIRADPAGFKIVDPEDPRAALLANKANAILHFSADFEKHALAAESATVTIELDRSRSSTVSVQQKLDVLLRDYERWIIQQRVQERLRPEFASKVKETLQPITRKTEDVATSQQRMGNMLALMLPLLLLMTGMLGALFPALNATTTERELGTLETLLVTPAGRMELLCAKGLLVLLTGLLTAALNMASMSAVLWYALSLISGDGLTVSPAALGLAYLAAVPSILFFTTVVLIVGLMARNFREANSFATPVMLIPLASVAVGILEPKSNPALLITPVVGTSLIIREVLTDQASWQSFLLAFVSSTIYTLMLLGVAARLFSNEQLVNPAWEPVSIRFGRSRALRPRPRRLPGVDGALALFSITLLLTLYVGLSTAKLGLAPNLVITELGLILLPTLVLTGAARLNWRETFSLRPAGTTGYIGAVMVGIGAVPVIQALNALQSMIWPADPAQLKELEAYMEPALRASPVLVPLLAAVLAGFCEEMLFRGPIQTAFLRRLPAWAAIGGTAILFGLAHFDLHGMALRALLGAVLGWIVYRRGSIFPAMVAHAVYDFAALSVQAWSLKLPAFSAALENPGQPATLGVVAVGVALVISGILLIRRKRPAEATVLVPAQLARPY